MGLLKLTLELDNLEHNRKMHSIGVANVAKLLANKLKLSEQFGYICGLMHDIGYAIDKDNHPLAGYNLMMENRLDELAPICLLHSHGEAFHKSVAEKAKSIKLDKDILPYLEIVSVADFFVDGKGDIVGPEKRCKDICERYTEDSMQVKVALTQHDEVKKWLAYHKIDNIVACLNLA